MASWTDIVVGYGLERVPSDVRPLVHCAICCTTRTVLWTAADLRYDGTQCGLKKLLERLHGACYCRVHVRAMYG